MKLTNADVLDKIKQKVQEILEFTGPITPNQDLVSIGLNSLKTIILIIDLEESFNIMFKSEELLLEHFSTIEHIANKVVEKLGV